ERLVAEPVVLVDELDEVPARDTDTRVAGLAGPAGVLLVDHPHVRMLGGQAVQARRGLIRRAVVDEDQLEPVGWHGLPQQRRDARLDVLARVVDRYDD